jgi:hypothetical protein
MEGELEDQVAMKREFEMAKAAEESRSARGT